MRIGFDVSQTGKSKAGCGYFADGLIRELAASDTSNEYVLYPAVGEFFWDPECAAATFSSNRPNFRKLKPPSDFDASRRFWRTPGADFEQLLGSPDIVHINNFYCPRGMKQARLVYTLYDLSFLQEPGWSTETNRVGCFHGVFGASINADWIVAISEFSRSHFLSIFPHYPKSRVSVIYPASRFEPAPSDARPERFSMLERGGFWLSVGTIEPRKNHAKLLEGYRTLKAGAGTNLPLVLAGGKGWKMPGFEVMAEGLTIGEDLFLPGYISDADLRWLFRNCFAFVYPSLFEGFGMPVLEALGLGAPVICSNSTSLPEAAGNAALYIDPTDAHSIAAAMDRLARGEANRGRLVSEGYEQAKRFSWANSASRLQELYREAIAQPRGAGISAPAPPQA
jgi:glycosyltransferase involved in cell wall biosynthesis